MLWPATLANILRTMPASSNATRRTPAPRSRRINMPENQQALLHAISAIPASRSYRIQPPVALAVGGDYFDVFPLSDGRTAFLIADVSG